MENVLELINEIDTGKAGIIIYSPEKHAVIGALNSELLLPLASAAKVAVGFCIAKLVEDGHYHWDDLIEGISFNPNEDSAQIYPHFQNRKSLPLQDAVEVMIACHDSFVGNRIVQFCGGWERIHKIGKTYFSKISITQNPRDIENSGEITQILELLSIIYSGYHHNPALWSPIINGLVRQHGEIDGIPTHHNNHMTGGLENATIHLGILGEFSKEPLLYVIGAKDLPNRNYETKVDEKIIEAIRVLYKEYFIKTECSFL
ncbi:serine hydrolase [Fredinandcohnia humi]